MTPHPGDCTHSDVTLHRTLDTMQCDDCGKVWRHATLPGEPSQVRATTGFWFLLGTIYGSVSSVLIWWMLI